MSTAEFEFIMEEMELFELFDLILDELLCSGVAPAAGIAVAAAVVNVVVGTGMDVVEAS